MPAVVLVEAAIVVAEGVPRIGVEARVVVGVVEMAFDNVYETCQVVLL